MITIYEKTDFDLMEKRYEERFKVLRSMLDMQEKQIKELQARVKRLEELKTHQWPSPNPIVHPYQPVWLTGDSAVGFRSMPGV